MSTELQDLYREVILDHARHPRRAGLREPFTVQVHQVNPTCGDEVTMRLLLAGPGGADRTDGPDATIADLSYDSLGCSISVASASVLAEAVTGSTVAAALARYDSFHALVTGALTPGVDSDGEDDAEAFAGVSRFPARVKCALLGWTALRQALTQAADSRA